MCTAMPNISLSSKSGYAQTIGIERCATWLPHTCGMRRCVTNCYCCSRQLMTQHIHSQRGQWLVASLNKTQPRQASYPVEAVVNGLKKDAAQHGTSLAALISVLVDEGAQLAHGHTQILIQLEVCWNLDCHLVSLHSDKLLSKGCCTVTKIHCLVAAQ